MFLVSLLLFNGPQLVTAEYSYNAAFFIDTDHYTLNGVEHSMDVAPFAIDDALYYPLRFIVSAMGIAEEQVFWDEPLQRVVLNWQGGSVEIWLDKQTLRVTQGSQDEYITLEGAPVLHQGRVMLPLPWIVRAFELDYSLNPLTKRLNIGNNAEFFYQLGFDCLEYGYDYDAIMAFELSLELEPYQSKVHNELGYAYSLVGQYDAAWENLSLAIGLDGTSGNAYSNRAYVSRVTGNYDGAIRDYSRAIQFGSNVALNLNNRGSLFFELGMYLEAWYDFSDAIAAHPTFAPAYFNRGYTLQTVGELDLALEDYRMAVNLDPQSELYAQILKACEALISE